VSQVSHTSPTSKENITPSLPIFPLLSLKRLFERVHRHVLLPGESPVRKRRVTFLKKITQTRTDVKGFPEPTDEQELAISALGERGEVETKGSAPL